MSVQIMEFDDFISDQVPDVMMADKNMTGLSGYCGCNSKIYCGHAVLP